MAVAELHADPWRCSDLHFPAQSSEMSSDMVKVPSLAGGLSVAGWSSPRPETTSEVKETHWREASSSWDEISAMCGRTLGSPSQHLSVSIQTSSERPRISRPCGREGRLLSRTCEGTRIGGTWENGRSCAKTYRKDPQDRFTRRCNGIKPRR